MLELGNYPVFIQQLFCALLYTSVQVFYGIVGFVKVSRELFNCLDLLGISGLEFFDSPFVCSDLI